MPTADIPGYICWPPWNTSYYAMSNPSTAFNAIAMNSLNEHFGAVIQPSLGLGIRYIGFMQTLGTSWEGTLEVRINTLTSLTLDEPPVASAVVAWQSGIGFKWYDLGAEFTLTKDLFYWLGLRLVVNTSGAFNLATNYNNTHYENSLTKPTRGSGTDTTPSHGDGPFAIGFRDGDGKRIFYQHYNPIEDFVPATYGSGSTEPGQGIEFQVPVPCTLSGCEVGGIFVDSYHFELYKEEVAVSTDIEYDGSITTNHNSVQRANVLGWDYALLANTKYQLLMVAQESSSRNQFHTQQLSSTDDVEALGCGQNFYFAKYDGSSTWTYDTTRIPNFTLYMNGFSTQDN